MTIPASVLRKLALENESIHSLLITNEQVLFVQSQQSAACNALHSLEERLSRWILLVRDFVGSDTLNLTQEFVSQMIGVRRTIVSLAAGTLQTAVLISYRSGHIQGILDVECL